MRVIELSYTELIQNLNRSDSEFKIENQSQASQIIKEASDLKRSSTISLLTAFNDQGVKRWFFSLGSHSRCYELDEHDIESLNQIFGDKLPHPGFKNTVTLGSQDIVSGLSGTAVLNRVEVLGSPYRNFLGISVIDISDLFGQKIQIPIKNFFAFADSV